MHKQKHRHLVAAPIAILAILTVAGLSNLVPARAEVDSGRMTVRLSSPNADQTFAIGGGVAGILRQGSALLADDFGSRLALKEGQMLLRASEFVSLDLGDSITASAVRGSFVAVREGGAVTVAALDTPLVIANGTSNIVLAPGSQSTFKPGQPGTVTTIGSEWYTTQLSDLAMLSAPVLPAIGHQGLAAAIDQHDLKDCVSIVSEGHLSHSDLRSALSTLLQSGHIDVTTYDCIRSFSDSLDPPGTLRELSLLTLAAEGARTDTTASAAIAGDFTSDPMLRSALPDVLPLLAIVTLKPLQPSLLDIFPTAVIETGLSDPARAVAILQRTAMLPKALVSAGLPLQSEAWKSVIARAITVLKTTVPEEQRSALDASLTQVLGVQTVKEQPVASAKPVPTTHWSADELTAITRDVLMTHGALVATTTALTPDTEAQTVRVEGVFIAEGGWNVPYGFSYDPGSETVKEITRDGRKLPNAVPLKTFFGQ